jgi:hypothetical protein
MITRRSLFALLGAAVVAPALSKVAPKLKGWTYTRELTFQPWKGPANMNVAELYPEFAKETMTELVYDHNPLLKLL